MTVILQEYNKKPVRPLRNHVSLTSVLFQQAPDLGQTHARSLLQQNETFGDILSSLGGKIERVSCHCNCVMAELYNGHGILHLMIVDETFYRNTFHIQH